MNAHNIFSLSIIEREGVLGIEYELKELRMNVYDMFWMGIGLRITNIVGGGLNSMSAI